VQIKGLVDRSPYGLGIFALGKSLIHGSPIKASDMKISCPGPGIGSAERLLHAIPEVSESHVLNHIRLAKFVTGTLDSWH